MAESKVSNKYGLYVDEKLRAQILEQFKSDTPTNPVKFPKELGEEHPFEFKQLEELYKKFGVITGAVDKYVDFIVGPGFYIKTETEKAKTILDSFMHDVNFDTILRQWVRQALIKGSSPLEIGYSKGAIAGLKVLNADYFYVKRNKKGEVERYYQYAGKFDKIDRSKVIEFETKEIAFLTFNQIGDSPYGIGIVYPAMNIINNILKSEKDMHMLTARKANSPLHIKLGNMEKEDIPTDEEVTNFGEKLEYMTNKQEWCTGPNVEMSVVDFGNLSEKFSTVLDHDMTCLLYTLQIPEVLMGKGSIPEGLAGVQMDAWTRRTGSYQAETEKIIETQIFDVILLSNKIDADVEFEWGQPSNAERNEKITRYSELLKNPMLSPALFKEIELQLADLLGIDKSKLETPKEEKDKEETAPQAPVPGQQKELYTFTTSEYIEGELIR